MDDHDHRLLSHVRPPDYRNPSAAAMYDLVVIGGGTAGLVCAAGAAGLGARVALVERNRLGGDCLNTGCVPSKALLHSARVADAAREGAAARVAAAIQPDFAAVMARLRARRADLAPHDSVARLVALGVDVFLGTAAFVAARAVEVRDDRDAAATAAGAATVLRFRKAVIATGSRPAVPGIPGLADTPFLTTDTLFELQSQPASLAILGGGPVGCEMAQAFARLGTRVWLFEPEAQLLPREDADAAALLATQLGDDGVNVCLRTRVERVRYGDGAFTLDHGGHTRVGALLVATGRTSTVDPLALEAAGVRHDAGGVLVDDHLRTSNRRVFAAGDVCSPLKFTHAADAMARIVIQNALFHGRKRVSSLVVPWCTFTSPEVAHVGSTSAEAAARGASTITIPLSKVDRAVVDEATSGFVRVHHQGGRIVGATIVGPSAGELVTTVALAMRHGWSLGNFASVIAPYPTLSTALRQAGDEYRRQGLTPAVKRMLRYYFRAFR